VVRRRAAASETETDDDQTDPETNDASAPDETNDAGDTGGTGLEGRIREIVREVVGPLLEPGTGNSRRPVDDEQSMTDRVRSALDKVKAEEEREHRVSKVEETLQKVIERPPARAGIVGRVQRVMWGDE
jgi:hypothetical protein